jgi:hypothetical protein
VCAPARVLYVDAENGPWEMRRRFGACAIPMDGLLVADGTRVVTAALARWPIW